MSEFEKAERRAWRFFKQWRKQKTFCKALNRYIRVSEKGWGHISGSANKSKRVHADMLHRFEILPHAREVIMHSETYEKQVGKDSTFYILEDMVREKRIRVVLAKDKKDEIIFLSVIDKTKKR